MDPYRAIRVYLGRRKREKLPENEDMGVPAPPSVVISTSVYS